MEMLQLTRKEMSELLICLKGDSNDTPLSILQRVWLNTHQRDIEKGKTFSAFISTALPPILEKLIKLNKKDIGFSLNEIVALGNQIEYTHFSSGAVQNWVKRDIKDWIGTPQIGKKYAIEQAAMLFMVEDLKANLDFESIRKLFTLIFNNPNDYNDDLIDPISLYAAYSSIFEELDKNNDQVLDMQGANTLDALIRKNATAYVEQMSGLNAEQKEAVSNTIVIATLSVQTSYFQNLAKRYLNATLFLSHLGKV
ncbi:DUF1836 domain-containing protein [Ammoniphilus sp. CFH 90114]|uniref:DUF1836 domain-containing protein n=1 Tax=Ammoniphilus sp. CFH 90114 TaxID=2493665 RepID=UPI00100FAFDD|nr:DUF1836 domain-containing protein [Ammoniphilus sp. CFH 90114]RXT03874.1 DUF1836 domain-containing protein [Ammoniphilus sp. CFH 90114]